MGITTLGLTALEAEREMFTFTCPVCKKHVEQPDYCQCRDAAIEHLNKCGAQEITFFGSGGVREDKENAITTVKNEPAPKAKAKR